MNIDKMSKEEISVVSELFDIVDDDDKKQIIDSLFAGGQTGLTDIEQEDRTWAALERIHGTPGDVTRAIIRGGWIRRGVIKIPYSGIHFTLGTPGHLLEIDVNSEFVITKHYVSRIYNELRNMRRDIDHTQSNMRRRPKNRY